MFWLPEPAVVFKVERGSFPDKPTGYMEMLMLPELVEMDVVPPLPWTTLPLTLPDLVEISVWKTRPRLFTFSSNSSLTLGFFQKNQPLPPEAGIMWTLMDPDLADNRRTAGLSPG